MGDDLAGSMSMDAEHIESRARADRQANYPRSIAYWSDYCRIGSGGFVWSTNLIFEGALKKTGFSRSFLDYYERCLLAARAATIPRLIARIVIRAG